MLADSQGPALFIGTPKGKNWFHDLYFKQDPDWQSWGYPTSINKYIKPEEIEQAKKDMSERLFRQEFLAEFLDDETGVFKKIRQCITDELQDPQIGRFYVLGIDLAKTQDFTVLAVLDGVTRHLVAFERFQDVSWSEQKFRIQSLAHKYNNALCIIDSTGIGDPITEDLQHSGLSLYYEGDKPGFRFTNESKNRLIDNLAIAIEQRLITFPNIEVLIDELQQYEYQISVGGTIKYGAPESKHDDCVTALALAVWGLRSQLREAQVFSDAPDQEIRDRQGHGELVIPEDSSIVNAGY
jgi:phage FluMu gp28-like protein